MSQDSIQYVPLTVHSHFSILSSSISIKELVSRAKEMGLKSLALTDQYGMFGVIDFFKECKSQGIKPVIGCELMIAPGSCREKKRVHGEKFAYPITILSKNMIGYKNLCKLSSFGHTEGFYYTPRVDAELLEKYSEGLIALVGGVESRLAHLLTNQNLEQFDSHVKWLKTIFKEDLFFSVSRHAMSQKALAEDGVETQTWLLQKMLGANQLEKDLETALLKASKKFGISCVATHGIYYLDKDDFKAHEILVNVATGEPCEIYERDDYGKVLESTLNPKRRVMDSYEHYFKSPKEMQDLFVDLPEALALSVKIADMCEVDFDFDKKYYPVFVPPQLEGTQYEEKDRKVQSQQFLRDLCFNNIEKRYTKKRLQKVEQYYPDKDPIQVVKDRLEYELGVIFSKEMGDYLLIVYDFIAWAKGRGIPVGPGRGSGAGSIILYLIGVTDIEPLRFQLFFERFINPERLSYPDIDVDICMHRRAEVIDYTINKYGSDKVAQIVTFGTMKAKMAIKDVGRMLSIPLAKVNVIAKLIPEDPSMTLDKALEIDPDLLDMYNNDSETTRLIDIAKRLEGVVRNTGIHAAGVIISAEPLTEHIPIFQAKGSQMLVTQFAMKPVEAVGMLKIDFLGLKTLTSIQNTVDIVELQHGQRIDWADLDLTDQKTFDLLNEGKTQGIFQLESSGMQELVKKMHVDAFEQIIAITALYRPGPMQMIPSFVSRKRGEQKIEYNHELLKDILKETYGIMVYQEQVMQLSQKLANYSLGEGDVLRRAMGKKDKEEMSRQKEKFCKGAQENDIDEALALDIFEKVERFASYGFNKSHAAAYAYLSYVTAYLKANWPKEWMAAQMTCDISDLSKVAKHINEAKDLGLKVHAPDVNESREVFTSASSGIRFALCAIKGVGRGLVDEIVAERESDGKFKSLYDFIYRVDNSKVGKKVVEQLILAGCFDFTSWSRKTLVTSFTEMYEAVIKKRVEKKKGVLDLFSQDDSAKNPFEEPVEVQEEFSETQKLFKEKELLGFFVSGHPLEHYCEQINDLKADSLDVIDREKDGVYKVVFIIETLVVRISSRTNKKWALMTISDGSNSFDVPVWPDLYEKISEMLEENRVVAAVLQVQKSDELLKIQCKWISPIEEVTKAMCSDMQKAYRRSKSWVEKDKSQQNAGQGEAKVSVTQKLELKCSIDQLRLTDVLAFKKIFMEYPGSNQVLIHLHRDNRKLATLELGLKLSVHICSELKEKLKETVLTF
jgi:DNA polymerase III subunit alpha